MQVAALCAVGLALVLRLRAWLLVAAAAVSWLAVEVVLAYRQVFEPVHMLEVLLILSVIKSALIIGYFMHLKFEKALMRWLLVISVTACFIIMYFFFFPDAGRVLRLGVQ